MRASLPIVLSLSSAALMMSGCLTTQENPNYEYSSRYETGATTVADTMPLESTQVSYETQPAAPIQSMNVVMESAPTDANYAAQDVTGTPGYMLLVDQPAETVTASSAQPVEYDYSQNFITVDSPMAAPDIASEVRILPSAGRAYIVQPGDTVYGLSRRNCVGVDVIRSMNGIGGNYAINIGQTIQMPASKC